MVGTAKLKTLELSLSTKLSPFNQFSPFNQNNKPKKKEQKTTYLEKLQQLIVASKS